MNSVKVYKTLNWLNELPANEAEDLFYECSGSLLWAGRMSSTRPFNMLESLFDAAEKYWFSLPHAERISAFSRLPDVGRMIVSPAEVSATEHDDGDSAVTESNLAAALSLYQEKFGFIFVLSANGKSSEEQLAICNARFGNSAETELKIAAEEHGKIIEVRLNKLLEQ